MRADVEQIQRDIVALKDGYVTRDRFLFGWIDHEGHHPGIIEVLSTGMTEANRELALLNHRVSDFFTSLRTGAMRAGKWLAGLTGAAIAASIWYVAQHPAAVAKALHDLTQ